MIDPGFIALFGTIFCVIVIKLIELKFPYTPQVPAPKPVLGLESYEKQLENEYLPSQDDDYANRWNEPNYVNMIHATQDKEKENLGYVLTLCDCAACKAAHKDDNYEWVVDTEKINAATRAAKEVTERVYYVSKDNPNVKPTIHLNSQKFVPDPYSALKRLEEDYRWVISKLNSVTRTVDWTLPSHLLLNTPAYFNWKQFDDMRIKLEGQIGEGQIYLSKKRSTYDLGPN